MCEVKTMKTRFMCNMICDIFEEKILSLKMSKEIKNVL
jgi:hypothetical protein